MATPPYLKDPYAYAPPSRDEEHLHLLRIFHFVLAGLATLFGFFPMIYVVLGVLMLTGNMPQPPNAPPEDPANMKLVGAMLTTFGAVFSLLGWSLAVCLLFAGRFLGQRRKYNFCLFTAGFCCLWMPLGTVLGVFTFLVLLRPSVKDLFMRATPVDPFAV